MVRVYLDTNILLAPGRHHVDVWSQIEALLPEKAEFVVVAPTVQELEKLAASAGQRDRMAARLALVLIKQKHLKVVRSFLKKSADDVLVQKATPDDYVATQDKALKQRLKSKNINILTLKGKRHMDHG